MSFVADDGSDAGEADAGTHRFKRVRFASTETARQLRAIFPGMTWSGADKQFIHYADAAKLALRCCEFDDDLRAQVLALNPPQAAWVTRSLETAVGTAEKQSVPFTRGKEAN